TGVQTCALPILRIGHRLTGRAEKDRDLRGLEGVTPAEFLRALLEDLVGRGEARIRNRAQHSLGGRVVRRERSLPVLGGGPVRALEAFRSRDGERVREDQASASDPGA